MNNDWIRNALTFISLLALQVVILNGIHLFGCATPLLYVLFPIALRQGTPRWAALLWCFALGIAVDLFSNTWGMTAASLTLIGMLQPYILPLFTPRDNADALLPSAATMGRSRYTLYTAVLVTLHCAIFFTLELFSFFHWQQWLLNIVGSAVATLLLVWIADAIVKTK